MRDKEVARVKIPTLRKDRETPRKKPDSILAYLLRTREGTIFNVECVDITDTGMVFSCDPEMVQNGLLPDYYIDSRYFAEWGLELIIVPNPPELEQ